MPPLPLDDLVNRIRAEAASLERELPATAIPQASPGASAPRLPALAADDWQALLHGEQLAIADLLGFAGKDFIEATYQAILGRIPDPGGVQSIRHAFDTGASRLEIITRLRLSDEGRQRARRLQGWHRGLDLLQSLRPRRIARLIFRQLESRLLRRNSVMALPSAKYANHLATILNQGLVDLSSRRIGEVEQRQLALNQSIATLEQLSHQNRRDFLYAQLRDHAAPVATAAPSPGIVGDDVLNAYYVAFEDANRGSKDEIRAKQLGYIAVLDAAIAGLRERPVLDIGCGRGEWLALLGEHGYRGEGIDLNPVMVSVCRDQGLQAECADILAGLARIPDDSLAAITSFHVIEHLPFPVLFSAVEQAWRALAPGGLLILETPNPENLLVGSHTFYHDFTHRNPVTPAAITFLVRYLNFTDIRIERLNPYPESAKVPGIDLLTERVNGHLCGPQDFAVIARKPQLGDTGKAA